MSKNKIAMKEQIVKLRQRQIDAYHLGLQLRELGRVDEKSMARSAALAGEFLIGWAELVAIMIREREAADEVAGSK